MSKQIETYRIYEVLVNSKWHNAVYAEGNNFISIIYSWLPIDTDLDHHNNISLTLDARDVDDVESVNNKSNNVRDVRDVKSNNVRDIRDVKSNNVRDVESISDTITRNRNITPFININTIDEDLLQSAEINTNIPLKLINWRSITRFFIKQFGIRPNIREFYNSVNS